MKQTKWNQPHEYEPAGAIDFRGEVLCHCGLPPDNGLHLNVKPKVSEWESTFELLLNYHIPDKEGIPMVMNYVKDLLDQQKQEMVEMVEEHICPLEENHSDKVNGILDDIINKLEGE